MATNEVDIWKELRKPFDPKVIGKIPKGGTQLDYVGHAAVTDRLLSVDPTWTWAPAGRDEYGNPALDTDGNLWIELTIGGVTRLGVGDGKSMKERVGDAIRNGAMRFGVALDLWTKDELESTLADPELKNAKASEQPEAPERPPVPEPTISTEQMAELMQLAKKKGYTVKKEAVTFLDGAASFLGVPFFTHLPESDFDAFKKVVIESGWKAGEGQTNQ